MNSKFDAIIFDFGAVILNLNEQLTYNAMAKLLDCHESELISKINVDNLFYDFEMGKISSETFIRAVQNIAKRPISADEIINAWNAMLLDFPQAHANLLLNLKQHFRTFLLSNTNAIHEDSFVASMAQAGIPSMQELFEIPWYSHTLGLRKPNHDIFEEVIRIANLNPSTTLFLDDRLDNITAAQEVGLHTILVTKENGILSIFKEFI